MASVSRLALFPLFSLLIQCTAASSAPEPGRELEPSLVAQSNAELTVYDDDLNGLWRPRIDGKLLADPSMIESWSAVGVRLSHLGEQYPLTRNGETLSLAAPPVSLAITANDYTTWDDQLVGTLDGHEVTFQRDTRNKSPIVVELPGDRPFRSFLVEQLMPLAQRDRESYTTFYASRIKSFLKSCELYESGWFQYRFIKGETWNERSQNLLSIADSVNYLKTTPRRLIKEKKFVDAVKANLKDESQAGLALTTLAMYFSTGAGRALRISITDDSMAYFITDRPNRGAKIGLVAMDTPLHGPLASTFGRQLLDFAAMPSTDDDAYTRTLMELLVKSEPGRAEQLSPAGRSAITDWYAVMAIEDYRGMAFGWPALGWGYNMTNVQFFGLVTRALARPGSTDAAGNPVVSQVLVGSELRPGDASYADVLNNGNDMQEYTDMANLKRLATQFLRQSHASKVSDVEAAFANVIPKSELDYRAQNDVFHFITAQLYDVHGRTKNLTGASATQAIESVAALLEALRSDSAAFEAFVLSKGYTQSNQPAPQSTGY